MSTDQEREYQQQSAMESKIDSIQTQVDEVCTLANNTYDVIGHITDLFGVTKEMMDSMKNRITELEKKS